MNRFFLLFFVFCGTAFGQYSARKSPINIAEFGFNPNASAAVNRASLLSAMKGLNNLLIPAGTYNVDNAAGAVYLYQFNGAVTCEPGVIFRMSDKSKGGFWFYDCSARLTGMTVDYAQVPDARFSPNEAIKLDHCTNIFLEKTRIKNSPAAAVLFYACINPTANDTIIDSCLADGLHFANCKDAVAKGLTSYYTGDDALVFVNYSTVDDNEGGTASDIAIYNSDRYGIRVNGQSNVTISNFRVDNTVKSGVHVVKEDGEDGFFSRVPYNVNILNGTILNAGKLAGSDGCGVRLGKVGSVQVSNLRIINSYISAIRSAGPCGPIKINNIYADGCSAEAGLRFSTGTTFLDISNVVMMNSWQFGLYATGAGEFYASNLTFRNSNLGQNATPASGASVTGGAFRLEGLTNIHVDGLTIIDDQATPSGYAVSEFHGSNTATGTIMNLYAFVPSGAMTFSKTSTAFNYGQVNRGTYLQVPQSTASTTSTTGALVVAGGAGIAGAVNIGSTLTTGAGITSGGSVSVPGANSLGFATLSKMRSPSDGVLSLRNAADTGFTQLNFGGETSAFPSLNRSAQNLSVQLADGSAFAPLLSGAFTSSGSISSGSGSSIGINGGARLRSPSDGNWTLGNNANTDFSLLQFGGTSSSFPAIKKSSTALEVRFADDSGFYDIRARVFKVDATLTTAGVTGNVTINKGAGSARIAAAGTAVTVTNSLCTTSSIVTAVVATNDTTAYVRNAIPAAGSFTINLGAAATAETEVRWIVTNP